MNSFFHLSCGRGKGREQAENGAGDMMSKKKVADLPDFDPAKFLKDDEDVAAYLTVVIGENDPSLLAAALGDIARARGMTEIAQSINWIG